MANWKYCHVLSYYRRGLDWQLDLLHIYNLLQPSLSGLFQSHSWQLSISQLQLSRSWVSMKSFQVGNHTYGIPCLHSTLQPRTPWTPFSSLSGSHWPSTNSSAGNSPSASLPEIYNLWTDCREDTAFGIVGCLAITRKRLPSGPRRTRHNINTGILLVIGRLQRNSHLITRNTNTS
jgi:hypothetical protein